MGPGFFGDMFDMNKDGKMDCYEQAMELSFLSNIEKESLNEQLRDKGIDTDEFSTMSPAERKETLRDSGLDDSEYEDYDMM